jgi:peptidoglycan-N-acetylglucosamine deacetylase
LHRPSPTEILLLVLLACVAGCALQTGNPFQPAGAQPDPGPGTVGITPEQRLLSTAPEGAYLTPAEISAREADVTGREAEAVRSGTRRSHLQRGDPKLSEVALTFDDGPHRESTRNILAILSRYGVKATFFVVGQMAAASPDLVRAEAAAGHEIGNHTYHHLDLQKTPSVDAARELELCSREITDIIGHRPLAFRPPGGKYDDRVISIARSAGLSTILWTDDPADYASPGSDVIFRRVLDDVGPGSVILLHDGVEQTIHILPMLIEELRRRGLSFVTVSEMLQKMPSP